MKNILRTSAILSVAFLLATIAQAGPVITNGLVAYYSFDNINSGTLADGSGHGYTGAITGNVTTVTSTQDGLTHYGCNFANTSSTPATCYVTLPYEKIISDGNCPSSAFTMSTWVYTTSSTAQEIFSAWSDGSAGSGMVIHTELRPDATAAPYYRFVLRDATTTLKDLKFYENPNANDWHNVTMTYDGTNMAIYVDGSLGTSTPVSGSIYNWNKNACIGACANDLSRPFMGMMDEMYLFNRALSASEVGTLASSVPEPSTIALLAAGFIGLVAYAWRKRR
jgi:hypothetical protein